MIKILFTETEISSKNAKQAQYRVNRLLQVLSFFQVCLHLLKLLLLLLLQFLGESVVLCPFCGSHVREFELSHSEITQDRTQQMERWVEHDYSELSARENMASLEALNAIDCLPVLEDLESEPTKVELKEALGYLRLEKRAARMVILCLW
ncbi:unnamed protein product [Porites lobata]|uniref:Uncharacterized protein n=1 Tax=Porites lobata TaxID=104759 RepID=A0ABN8NTP6_9CNID|nr:unnamed protein product [Porites lobata]